MLHLVNIFSFLVIRISATSYFVSFEIWIKKQNSLSFLTWVVFYYMSFMTDLSIYSSLCCFWFRWKIYIPLMRQVYNKSSVYRFIFFSSFRSGSYLRKNEGTNFYAKLISEREIKNKYFLDENIFKLYNISILIVKLSHTTIIV